MLLCPWNKVERYVPWSSYIHAISGVCSSHYYQGFQELHINSYLWVDDPFRVFGK